MAHADLGYHQLHRGGPRERWRPVVGVLLLLGGMFALSFIGVIALLVEAALSGDFLGAISDPFDDIGPIGLAGLLLSLAALIPLALLLSWWLHALKPGQMISVAGRIRWRYLAGCFGLALLALGITLVVSTLVPSGAREELTASVNPVDGRMVALLLVALLVTPLQAAGEEIVFRGYLTQAVGGVLPTAFAVVVPAALFALAHGAQSAPVFLDRFAFGLIAGVLVVLTGGLEAGIAMHVVNNWLAFGLAVVLGNLGDSLQPKGGTWWTLPGTLTQSLVYLALAVWLARRQGLATRQDDVSSTRSSGPPS